MSEYYVGTIPVLGFLLMTAGCYMYMRGGRSDKWQRRFVGAFLLTAGLIGEFALLGKFNWWYLSIYFLTIPAFSKGYGSGVLSIKIFKRVVVVLISIVSSVVILWANSFPPMLWWVFSIECWIALVSVVLGTTNVLEAAPEEFFICACLWMPKLIYPFALT